MIKDIAKETGLRVRRGNLEGDPLAWAQFRHHVHAAHGFDPDTPHLKTLEAKAQAMAEDAALPPWSYTQPHETAADLARSDFFMRLWRPVLHVVVRLVFRVFFRFRVQGRWMVQGPFVLVANHSGHPDALALMASIPLRRVNTTHPLAAQDYFWKRKWVGALVHGALNALPIDRTASATDAMKSGLDLLADGRGVILFPEGTRSETGAVAAFKKGVGLLVAGTSIPIVPAWIDGSRAVLPKGATRPRLAKLRVRLGAPLRFDQVPNDRDGWKQVAAEAQAAVEALQ